jgi:hypothetical protein
MNAKNLAQLTVIVLATVLSQLAGQAQAPQLNQNYTLNNLPERSCPSESNRSIILFIRLAPEVGAPSRTGGGGIR